MTEPNWTREQLDFLTDHCGLEGWTYQRIADEMPLPKKSAGACNQKARYLGLAKIERRGNWKHPAKLYEDVHDMAILNYTQGRIASEIFAQHGIEVSVRWVERALKKEVPREVYRKWLRASQKRRAESVSRSWKARRAA